ncbi:single-stranded-DNA-specific exonuclease RecJ [Conchiformibius kuhniae]|uniref:Single-stranded-DNA-specific exonuclease RecJ n=1 Tax=Conchiformibius kuhniae TaxID=211502 RepID=A0ABD8B6Q9_9NEIS|nr:single-stranded-DNA-specific exonuclease RecJ [Conchiformibius kuhniae]
MPHAKVITRPVNPQARAALEQAGTSPLLARLFAARNVLSADELGDSLSALLPHGQLKGCAEAAQRLADAVQNHENILIIADYDADGATACTVALKGLRGMGAAADFFVPNRFEHGYGLTPELADIARTRGAQLILTVDNGISSREGVARARELGMDVVVTDHHVAGRYVPDCIIVNPNQQGCAFPSKNLAGVGVIFYVLTALRAELRGRGHFSGSLREPNLAELLDLVALGTVADVVPLDRNNRILVSQGLKRMRAGKMCCGIKALFEAARRDPRKAQPFDMGFGLGPRLNAAGRLDDMTVGIACLLAENDETAQQLAAKLNSLNQARQEIEQGMLADVLADFPAALPAEQMTLCAYRADFHQGVTGIVAGRLKERFYRPTFVFAPAGGGEVRGSGRSLAGLHLRDVVDTIAKRCPDLISRFGGHAMAAGLSMREDGLAEFERAFEQVVRETADESLLAQTYLTDGSLDAADLTLPCARELAQPVWGQGFPPPSFADEFGVSRQQRLGGDKQHVKAWLHKDGGEYEAMFWRCETDLPARVRVVYRPTVNEWRGNEELQLYAEYWEAA